MLILEYFPPQPRLSIFCPSYVQQTLLTAGCFLCTKTLPIRSTEWSWMFVLWLTLTLVGPTTTDDNVL